MVKENSDLLTEKQKQKQKRNIDEIQMHKIVKTNADHNRQNGI